MRNLRLALRRWRYRPGLVITATLVAYAPTLALLDLPGPALIPAWSGWLGLPAAVLAWIVAGALWRAGVRRYTGAGG